MRSDRSGETVVLLSGGVESSTLLYSLARNSGTVGLFIDYGQRAARRELAAAQAQCRAVNAHFEHLDMAAVGSSFRAGQLLSPHVPLPHRNLVILSLGLSYCSQIRGRALAIALAREDAEVVATAAPRFFRAFGRLARNLGDCSVVAPLMTKTKTQIIRQGLGLGVEFSKTYSCLLGHSRHCGRCPQCRKRRAAFTTAGVPESPGFYRAQG